MTGQDFDVHLSNTKVIRELGLMKIQARRASKGHASSSRLRVGLVIGSWVFPSLARRACMRVGLVIEIKI